MQNMKACACVLVCFLNMLLSLVPSNIFQGTVGRHVSCEPTSTPKRMSLSQKNRQTV